MKVVGLIMKVNISGAKNGHPYSLHLLLRTLRDRYVKEKVIRVFHYCAKASGKKAPPTLL